MTLDHVWRAAAPYLRVRKNDIHVPISFDYAERLLEEHPQADGLVVRLAILLHDIGWHTIDERDIFSEGFVKNWKQSDVRYLHESEGCLMARELLGNLGYDDTTIGQVVAIIDGHDTRPEARSLEDMLVRDADKLWRFTPAGIGIACDWFKRTPSFQVTDLMDHVLSELHTEAGLRIARQDLAYSRRLLQIGLL
jgi:HD domain